MTDGDEIYREGRDPFMVRPKPNPYDGLETVLEFRDAIFTLCDAGTSLDRTYVLTSTKVERARAGVQAVKALDARRKRHLKEGEAEALLWLKIKVGNDVFGLHGTLNEEPDWAMFEPDYVPPPKVEPEPEWALRSEDKRLLDAVTLPTLAKVNPVYAVVEEILRVRYEEEW